MAKYRLVKGTVEGREVTNVNKQRLRNLPNVSLVLEVLLSKQMNDIKLEIYSMMMWVSVMTHI